MRLSLPSLALILAFNAGLALVVMTGAPAQPKLSDRAEYDFNGRAPLAPSCPNSIYCYRILVPLVLEAMPGDGETRWRVHQWAAHTLTGTVIAAVVSQFASPYMAAVMLQTSYAFAFTAYDPYTPDPLVFLISALVLSCWINNRWRAVMLIAAIGVFAKETVALIASAPALAVVFAHDRDRKVPWLLPAGMAWMILLGFHWYMDTYAGWGISRNPAASFSTGSWLAIWWKNNPFLIRKALIVFSPFGFAWLLAALGFRIAPLRLRQLALGTIPPMLALVYVQTPERALGNAFFVVVPLAMLFLARVPAAPAWAAVITNGLLTARLGLSSAVLPSVSILMIPAAAATAWAISVYSRQSRLRSGDEAKPR